MEPPIADEVLKLWYHYEQIAMHFNELLMRFRLQLMGGFAALGTIASYIVGEKVQSSRTQYGIATIVGGGFCLGILAAAILDLGYYSQLLQGAVDALVALESQHPAIGMSTAIEKRVGSGMGFAFVFYFLLLAPLVAFSAWSARRWSQEARKPPAAVA